MKCHWVTGMLLSMIPCCTSVFPRSIHRTPEPFMPRIAVHTNSDPTVHTLEESHLREIPLFKTYDHAYMQTKLLPETPIQYRSDITGSVSGIHLTILIEELLRELHKRRRVFKHFSSLKISDFDWLDRSGLLVLKFKNHPFVLKLFIEHPHSLVRPLSKGFQVRGIFTMGGALRHLLGFTRFKNMDACQQLLAGHTRWKDRVTFPRKWLWLPTQPTWLHITGYNIGTTPVQTIQVPAIYAIICDALEKDEHQKPTQQECLALCADLEFRLDPHSPNFFIERGSGKIAIIDTEHFPTLVGAREKIQPVSNYISWYARIAHKYLKERFFSSKQDRLDRQLKPWSEYAL